MQITDTCFHCTEKLVPGQVIECLILQEIRYFCCPACMAIAQTIHDSGLDDYYCQRNSNATKIQRYDFSLWDNTALQQDFVTHNGPEHTAKLYIEGLHCTSCAWLIEKHLLKQPGISKAALNFQQQFLLVSWDENLNQLSSIMEAIANIGYLPHPYQVNAVKELQQKESKKMLKQIGITAILMMQIGMFSIGIYAGDFVGITPEYRRLLSVFSMLFSIPLLYFSALPFFTAAVFKLKNRQLSIDVSISIAIIGLYSSSIYSVITQTGEFYFDSIAMFCLFVLIARFIEKQSRMSLLLPNALLPRFATRINSNSNSNSNSNKEYETIPVNELHLGDSVVIRQGDTIPIDGRVTHGNSSVSEAFLNGEPKPIAKTINDIVYAGSTNHDGEMVISVINESNDTFVKKIEELSQQASQEKPQQKNFTDRIGARFTATVYLLAIGTFIHWYLAGNEHAFWIALSVLVISCPCALSLAAPTALSTVQHTLRQAGILVQSPEVMEKLLGINQVIFDKTGTLTEGRYTISRLHWMGNTTEQECLAIAHALEATSKHPIALAFTEPGLFAENITLFQNQGIEGTVNRQRYRIGNPAFCQQWHANILPPDNDGQWLGLCSNSAFLAWFLVNDQLREDAPQLVRFLQARKLPIHILSGDHSSAVDQIAEKLAITTFQKACTSADKLNAVKLHQQQGQRCLMVGDGINDAPVLSQSDVSVTLLSACDWVKNSTDIILLNNRLGSLAEVFHYTQRYYRIVRENFAWALLYNSLTIPLAMAGYVTPYWSAIGMSLSSVIVVINSRRLKKRL